MSILNKELFGQPYDKYDHNWIIKGYLDRMYNDGNFIKAIKSISERTGFSTDGAYCHFPYLDSYYEEDRFEGVKFIYGYSSGSDHDDEIIVSEEVCFHYVELASKLYLQKHPEDTEKVNQILSYIPK